MRDRRGLDSDGKQGGEKLGGTETGEAVIRMYLVRKILFSIKEKKLKNWNTSYLSSSHLVKATTTRPWVTVSSGSLWQCPHRPLCFFASFSKLTSLLHSVCVYRKPITSLPVEYHPMSSLSRRANPEAFQGLALPSCLAPTSAPGLALQQRAINTLPPTANSSSSSRSFLKCHLLQVLPDFPLCNALSPPI